MKYSIIEERVNNQSESMSSVIKRKYESRKTINEAIIKELKTCMDNNIVIEITEDEFIRVIHMYDNLYNKVADDFLNKLAEQSPYMINYMKVIDRVTDTM